MTSIEPPMGMYGPKQTTNKSPIDAIDKKNKIRANKILGGMKITASHIKSISDDNGNIFDVPSIEYVILLERQISEMRKSIKELENKISSLENKNRKVVASISRVATEVRKGNYEN